MREVLSSEWETDVHEEILAPPTIINPNGDARILIGTKAGKILTFSQQGKQLWEYDTRQRLTEEDQMFLDTERVFGINTPPKVVQYDGRELILVGTEEGMLHCLDTDGKHLWTATTNGPIRAPPSMLVTGKGEVHLMVGSHDEHIYIISLKGEIVQRMHVTQAVETSPIIMKQRIIVGTAEGMVVALDIKGEKAWSVKLSKRISANLTQTKNLEGEDVLLVACEDGTLTAIGDDGEIFWQTRMSGALLSQPVILQSSDDEKSILVGGADNSIYCVSLEDGEKLWSYETDFWIVCPPAIDKQKDHTYAIVGSYDNNVYIFDASGSYELDFIPGLGGVVNQSTYHASSMGRDVGEEQGKLLMRFATEGFVVGCSVMGSSIVAVTKKGKIYNLKITR